MNQTIINDELSRTREFRKQRQKRIQVLKQLGAPQIIIDSEEKIAKMTYTEYQHFCEQEEKQEEIRKAEFRKANPPNESVAKLIYEKFDLWFDKYKNDSQKLELELGTGHYFYEPWYWGDRAPGGAEEMFYVQILSEDDWWCENYAPVFEVCRQQIRNRLKELENA